MNISFRSVDSQNTDSTIQIHSYTTFSSNLTISIVIAIFMVLGTVGSLTTAIVIGKTQSLHTKANIFIFSLCISDLISALFCSPFWLYRRTWGFNQWDFGEATCKFYWISDYATNYLTSLHIVSFAILRYAAIKWPFAVFNLSKKTVICYVIFLWMACLLFASPLGHLMGVDLDRHQATVGSCWPSCSVANKEEGKCCVDQYRMYINVVNTILFYLPQIIIIVFSSLICYEINKHSQLRHIHSPLRSKRSNKEPSPLVIPNKNNIGNSTVSASLERNDANACSGSSTLGSYHHQTLTRHDSGPKEKQAFFQLILIVVAYGIGYIPTTVYLQYATAVDKSFKAAEADYWFGVASYFSLRLSECMNPLMYNLGSSSLRRHSKKFWKKIFCCNREAS